jgi:hypothetical protein
MHPENSAGLIDHEAITVALEQGDSLFGGMALADDVFQLLKLTAALV